MGLVDTGGGPVVLLVDDQAIVAEALRRMLADEPDIRLHHCAHSERSVFVARAVEPTVILQDLVMPGVDGFVLLEAYRADPALAQVPVIILSSNEDPHDKRKAFERGASDYLVKIPDKIELIARIRANTRSYRAQLERDAAYKELEALKHQLEQKNAILETLSMVDGLTGIANRRRFDEQLVTEWRRAQRNRTRLSLLLIDVDFFKSYNDHYGHPRGDECLRSVAGALVGCARRPDDVVARYGGEEFAVLLPGTEAVGALAVAEEARRAVEGLALPHERSQVASFVTVSLGVATVESFDHPPAELVDRADACLYAAKRAGRNRASQRGAD